MKITVNLARPESHIERTVYVWAPVLIVVTAAILAFLAISAWTEFGSYRSVHQSTLRYRAETQEMQGKQMRLAGQLRAPETLELYRQIGFLNGLIGEKRVSLSALTVEVARLVPGEARIAGLSLVSAKDGPVVSVTVEGPSADVVGEFLDRLEAAPDFDQITVQDQSTSESGAEKGLVTLRCSARYLANHSTTRRVDP